jgi:hypothetical protein
VLPASFALQLVRKAREALLLLPAMTSAESSETCAGHEPDLKTGELDVSYAVSQQVDR